MYCPAIVPSFVTAHTFYSIPALTAPVSSCADMAVAFDTDEAAHRDLLHDKHLVDALLAFTTQHQGALEQAVSKHLARTGPVRPSVRVPSMAIMPHALASGPCGGAGAWFAAVQVI